MVLQVTEEVRKHFMSVRPLKFGDKTKTEAAPPQPKLAVSACGRFSRPTESPAAASGADTPAAPEVAQQVVVSECGRFSRPPTS